MATLIHEPRTKAETAMPLTVDARWYKDAIIYELHIRSFADSDGDGMGDLRGVTQKLGYLQDLGVTTVWLLPFFSSPLKDDGYDIADYFDVHPQYGTLGDFQRLLEESHRRGLRVVTELVINHTSDQHAWFQRSRRAQPESPWRDYYVWSDTTERYREARIIFQDFETSNWTWDPVAQAYFWHRFYSHQPDLNFDHPEVREAIAEVLDYWFAMGVDGLRLDAVPYLFEREGTNCENLPETHAYLKRLRRHIDEKFPGRMLLAEANQWPEDAAEYFGNGDECHMNFHFPLMPRLFMAFEREDHFPIIDILEQTPAIDDSCQWGIFLRNHDELTLEMVTDEERDYMYRTYATDPQARINLGIRRRLAPLLRNNRRKIELMNGLLMSLPGTPVLYYGDEIGMGDNFYLGDRNGVRTPMQWSSDRNAGFSSANPQSLFLPVIIDPEYHYALRNVEVEQASPHSLWRWTRRLLELRKEIKAFGRGTFEALRPANAKVFAFLRQYEDETILVVANLSRFSQYVELDLSRFRGHVPIEIFGESRFPAIGELPYLLTAGPHEFFWFRLEPRESSELVDAVDDLPVVSWNGERCDLFRGAASQTLQRNLARYLARQRWFAGKARSILALTLTDEIESDADDSLTLLLLRVEYTEGEHETYLLPVRLVAGQAAHDVLADHPHSVITRLEVSENRDEVTLLQEASRDEAVWQSLLRVLLKQRQLVARHGALVVTQTTAAEAVMPGALAEQRPRVYGGQQSNSSAMFDETLILKLFRRVTTGVNPEVEIGRYLTDHAQTLQVPRMAAALEYRGPRNERVTVAVSHEYVRHQQDAWTHALDELGRYFERVDAEFSAGEAQRTALRSQLQQPQRLVAAAWSRPSTLAQQLVGDYLQSAELLGQRTGELHLALAEPTSDAAFAPEPFTKLYQRSLYQALRTHVRTSLDKLRRRSRDLPSPARDFAERVIAAEQDILHWFSRLSTESIAAQRLRCHGDFHLGQVLFTGKDFLIIDFEGEPERPISERRIKTSPLRDVAGIIRSLHYVAHAALEGQAPGLHAQRAASEQYEQWAEFWYRATSAALLRGYLRTARPAKFLPKSDEHLTVLLNVYLMEKALYELQYEINNRPRWVTIPLQGVLELVSQIDSVVPQT